MMQRIESIRQRNNIFIDTLQGHYDNFRDRVTNGVVSPDETIAEES